jgi:hypothetical protein
MVPGTRRPSREHAGGRRGRRRGKWEDILPSLSPHLTRPLPPSHEPNNPEKKPASTEQAESGRSLGSLRSRAKISSALPTPRTSRLHNPHLQPPSIQSHTPLPPNYRPRPTRIPPAQTTGRRLTSMQILRRLPRNGRPLLAPMPVLQCRTLHLPRFPWNGLPEIGVPPLLVGGTGPSLRLYYGHRPILGHP